ncbi:MAG: hypothetical protein M3443_08505 [Actinomycetota bacterium]|nr:hypothetical protein [Actinomycetota bacterium]
MRQHNGSVGNSPRPLWRGLDYGPALVVLDAATFAPTDLPTAWQTVEQRFQIAWCAVPAGDDSLHPIEDVLETLADRNVRTQVIAHGARADVAALVVAEFPEIVRGLILVGADTTTASTGVRTRIVAGNRSPDLTDPITMGEVLAAVEADDVASVRLSLPTAGEIALASTFNRLRMAHG